MIDYVPIVVWRGREYDDFGVPGARRGVALFKVQCAIAQIGKDGTIPVPKPWRDGTATLLPVGAVLYAVQGWDPACRITDGTATYQAVDPRGQVLTALCP